MLYKRTTQLSLCLRIETIACDLLVELYFLNITNCTIFQNIRTNFRTLSNKRSTNRIMFIRTLRFCSRKIKRLEWPKSWKEWGIFLKFVLKLWLGECYWTNHFQKKAADIECVFVNQTTKVTFWRKNKLWTEFWGAGGESSGTMVSSSAYAKTAEERRRPKNCRAFMFLFCLYLWEWIRLEVLQLWNNILSCIYGGEVLRKLFVKNYCH
jgi:hypothetical protein